MHLLTAWIRIEIMWNQQWNLYNSQSNHKLLQNFHHGCGRCDNHFPSKFCDFKIWSDVLFYSKLVSTHVCRYCICYIEICFYCVIPYMEYQEKNNIVVLKSWGSHRDGGRTGGATCQWVIISGVLGGELLFDSIIQTALVSYHANLMTRKC